MLLSISRTAAKLLASLAAATLTVCAASSSVPGDPVGSRTNETEVALGEALFFDSRLSKDQQRSCASCHQPEKGFADGRVLSQGADGRPLTRHTPHLYNLSGGKTFFWDGRVTSLEEQARVVMASKVELDLPADAAARRLRTVRYYLEGFQIAYPSEGITGRTVPRAIAAFVRSIDAGVAPFDRYLSGDSSAISQSAVRGHRLFVGRAGCVKCHAGAAFTDMAFHNTGVVGTDLGRAGLDRVGEFRMRPYPFFQTHKAFKTPGLRNVARTAPYFHNGSESTLTDVVRFYNSGGKASVAGATSPDVHPLGLSDDEVHDLVSFLESLSGNVRHVRITPPSDSDRFTRALSTRN
jgi:cytochrome c peroxidase